jgi:hypothetical protein
MASIDEVCDALAAAVATIPELRAKGYIDDVINPNDAHVFTREFDPRMVFTTTPITYQLGVRLFVRRSPLRSAQKTLRGFMEPTGSTSVLAAIEDEANWPTDVHFVEVTSIGQPFEYQTSGEHGASETFLAVDYDVTVVW